MPRDQRDIFTGIGEERALLLVAAVVWVIAGLLTLLWPSRVRTLTNPNWRRYEKFPLAATALIWYRVTGLGFVVLALFVILALLSH